MAFRRKIVVVLSLGVVVILLQMLALNILSSSQTSQQLPWKREDSPAAKWTAMPSLDHENPANEQKASRSSSPHPLSQQPSKGVGLVHQPVEVSKVLEKFKNEISRTQSKPLEVSRKEAVPTKTKSPPPSPKVHKEFNFFVPFPVPSSIYNCDISGIKDASSALSRAKSPECKELIRNVSCANKAKKLYNVGIKHSCPRGRYGGKGVENKPLELGHGPLARVVFLLSVHGRAVRQVKRLFKAIYHVDHYYYIHVDSRSDYLYRTLYEELSDFTNVYFSSWRMATIWGGASLLQMLLRALQDLEYVLTDWRWDYFINLSESDYPIRTNENLVKFLRAHRGENFVKTHGGELNKFIQKQGLDRTFVECDNHMWRVDTRQLPPDISVDGGSDWIAIHRNYSHYLVTNKDPFLVDIKRYYQFSLLPAESFFHTVLRNGPMCSTFVKTNLRVTNWNRKLGCRCQYKHIVDWCGCSPNDYLSKDFSRLKSPSDHSFFARKFEAIVNQDIIRQLDANLYGPLPSDLPGVDSYWESVYHSEDTLTRSSNARYTVYQSFLRTSRKWLQRKAEEVGASRGSCGLSSEASIKEVSVLRKADKFQGLILTIADGPHSDSLTAPIFEFLFTPLPHMTKFDSQEKRKDWALEQKVWALEVGSEWDGKESIFRNHGNILGVWDDPVAAVRVHAGSNFELNIEWEDPLGVKVSTYVMKVESSWFVAFHKPKLDRPIRPGLWTVRLQRGHQDLFQNDFMVVPLTHENKEVMSSPQSVNAQRPVPQQKGGISLSTIESWKANVSKSGADLERWVDDLVKGYWTPREFCGAGAVGVGDGGGGVAAGGGDCSWIPDCTSSQASSWSSLSPDPKSEIGPIQANGRLR